MTPTLALRRLAPFDLAPPASLDLDARLCAIFRRIGRRRTAASAPVEVTPARRPTREEVVSAAQRGLPAAVDPRAS
ncbi:MAG: hypothetical protein ACK4YQ_14975 [Phenylobacterium sp.]|uniref:hypothetical protein n=1 Tax=Phenylobacterium sp. TaxID=1871053 RepID=UPI00391BF212